MYNDLKNNKIHNFINDLAMETAVYEVIRNAFLSKKGQKDVQILAAERLAVDFLDEAWKELNKHRDPVTEETKVTKQVGL